MLKFGRIVALLSVLCLALPAAAVAEDTYEFDAALSLTGDCNVSGLDPIPDPGCAANPPEGPHPPGGRFLRPKSTAVDRYGNLYVASFGDSGAENGRVDVFDDQGRFITELADLHGPQSVAVDTKGNLYVLEEGGPAEVVVARYSPTTYEPEAGNIEYDNPRVVVTSTLAANGGLAVDPFNDHLFADFGDVIEEYGSAESGNALLGTITESLTWSNWVAVDGERRRLYASTCKESFEDCGIVVFDADAPHDLLEEVDASETPEGDFRSIKGWLSIAVDEETGHFFVDDLEATDNVYEFDENYDYVSTIKFSAFQGGNALQISLSNGERGGEDAVNRHYLFVPLINAAGRALAFRPLNERPPIIEGASATEIGETEALLTATIDPRGVETEYVLEYVSSEEFEETGFANAEIAAEGAISKSSQATEVSGAIQGLSPGGSYHFRVVATNKKGSAVKEGIFATYWDAPATSGFCPNQNFRIGFSASLPDCRAYELVTPADTNGRPPKGIGFVGDTFPTVHTSPSGNAVSFLTEGGSLPGIGNGSGTYNGDRYLASRGAAGWTTSSAGPSGSETTVPNPGGVSADQGHSFWYASREGPAVLEGEATRYVRYPDGHSEFIGRGSLGTDPRANGKFITENGGHIVFKTSNITTFKAQQLEPNAPPEGTEAVYDRTADEVTHVVSLLPGDVTPAAGKNAAYLGASADGEGIAFEVDNILYLRKNNAETFEIGEDVAFAGVSEGGERIFYVESGDLKAFDTTSEEVIAFTTVGNAVPVNVAPGGTRAYFVTTSVIPGGGQNPNATFAKAGQQNLYLSEEGDATFVATVTERDVVGEKDASGTNGDGLGLWLQVHATQPAKDPSRVTPDGSVLLFQSRANLDGYDPGGFAQIYRYDDVEDRLHCISCIPTKVAAAGGARLQSYALAQSKPGPPFSPSAFVQNLRADGGRAFFESEEALVSTDRNGARDVYQWEEQGVGTCARPGGCVNLISSGHGARGDFLYAVSSSGDDVFFVTEEILVAGDDDTLSIYDARVGGGFPEEAEDVCIGEGCRPPLSAPATLPARSKSVSANDNVKPKKTRSCPKGKRKVRRNGKVRCVKKHQRKQHRRSAAKKGAGR